MTRRWIAAVLLPAVTIVFATQLTRIGHASEPRMRSVANVPAGTAYETIDRPECPRSGAWTMFFKVHYRGTNLPITATGMPVVSGPYTDIPEFHDCQQLVADDGTNARFISLFAVFSRGPDSPQAVQQPTSSGNGTLVAEVFAYDNGYEALGIRKDFNCLFLRAISATAMEARMVSVGQNDRNCKSISLQLALQGTPLDVHVLQPPKASPVDYPPAARWDWDSANRQQYIGLKCGDAWCEIHSRNPQKPFASSVSYEDAHQSKLGHVARVKGWYDEQRLAFPGSGGPSVGNVVATLIPHPALATDKLPLKNSRFYGKWAPVAAIAIDGDPGPYAKKLTLEQNTAPTPTNIVSLCYASAGKFPCIPPTSSAPRCQKEDGGPGTWWAKSVAPSGRTAYRCVIRRAHSGFQIPGIVRWRWMLDDDTIWVRCLDGCCEIEATSLM